MSSKRKWDQDERDDSRSPPPKAIKNEDSKSASEAAAAAAAIAAKIAAQFANSGTALGPRDPHDGDYTHDIDINEQRNRYLLTKGSTQEQVCFKLVICSAWSQAFWPTDSRRDWRLSHDEGCVVSGSIKSDREGSSAVSAYL